MARNDVRPSLAFSVVRGGLSTACQRSQITSISALLAIDFRVTCGERVIVEALADVALRRRERLRPARYLLLLAVPFGRSERREGGLRAAIHMYRSV